jgi:phosphatidate cytidylyltransferase
VAQKLGLPGLLGILIGLTALSITGDLYESLLKREAGVKDSGRSLPGHGGFLDRMDALMPVLPVGFLVVRYLSQPLP